MNTKTKKGVKASSEKPAKGGGKKKSPSDEIYAAIALALYEYQHDYHDVEDAVLTIHRVARSYSPWSSKIYGLRYPNDIKGRTKHK